MQSIIRVPVISLINSIKRIVLNYLGVLVLLIVVTIPFVVKIMMVNKGYDVIIHYTILFSISEFLYYLLLGVSLGVIISVSRYLYKSEYLIYNKFLTHLFWIGGLLMFLSVIFEFLLVGVTHYGRLFYNPYNASMGFIAFNGLVLGIAGMFFEFKRIRNEYAL